MFLEHHGGILVHVVHHPHILVVLANILHHNMEYHKVGDVINVDTLVPHIVVDRLEVLSLTRDAIPRQTVSPHISLEYVNYLVGVLHPPVPTLIHYGVKLRIILGSK